MDWPALLASTARILDLHDCDRAAGASTYAPPERRPGAGTGVWMDVATQLMQYLYERDLENNEAWVPIEGIIDTLTQRHGITKEDVIFVANYLATPTRIISIKEGEAGELQRQTLKRETALIEWPRNSKTRDRCRLSATGSRSVLLAQAAQKWLYAANDAAKLLKAVEFGAYTDIPQLAEGLIAQIRRFSKEITLLLERRHMEELLAEFVSRREDYLAVIKGVQQSVEMASDTFGTKQIKEHFRQWLDTDAGQSFAPNAIVQSFTDILQAIERLNRKFQKLVSALVSTKREVIGLVRFDEAAMGLAFQPCSEEITALCIAALGPWSAAITAPAPIDFIGILDLHQEERSTTTLMFDDVPSEELPLPIERFLAAYREQILGELQTGPVSLSEAISKGWLLVDDLDVLPQLVGVYTAPDWLDESNSDLAVSVAPGELNILLPDSGRLEGDDLILHWLKPVNKGQEV